jgi:GH18 family chitinase
MSITILIQVDTCYSRNLYKRKDLEKIIIMGLKGFTRLVSKYLGVGIHLLVVIMCFFSIVPVYAQRIVGYYPDYRGGSAAQVQYSKMTHLVYAFHNSDNSGNLLNDIPSFNTVVNTNARVANPGIKVIISTGGAGSSSFLSPLAASPSALNKFANNMTSFIHTNNLDGWDLDWEFPSSTTDKNNHQAMVTLMRHKLDSLELIVCKKLEISLAVGGETNPTYCNPCHTNYMNLATISFTDIVNVMAYDFCGYESATNHSPLNLAQEAVNGWIAFGVPASKINLAVPFYGYASCGTAYMYSQINSGNSAAVYGTDNSGGYQYNGCPTLQLKVDFARTSGLAGIAIWEVGQDLFAPTSYSLLANCLQPYITSSWGTPPALANPCATCRKPNLGPDVSTCGSGFPVTLNTNTPTATNVTFTWKQLPSTVLVNASATATTLSVTAAMGAGTYVVLRDSASCAQSDTIIISSSLPVPNLGSTLTLCTTTSYNLTPSNLSSFPSGTTWQWQLNAVNIAGATSSTLSNVRAPGNYTLIASITGCANQSGSVTVNSSLPTPVDGCISSGGIVNLSITNTTGGHTYTWYNAATGGSSLATGTTYSPNVSATTTFYVQDGGSTTNYSVGLAGPANSFQNTVGAGLGLYFTVSTNTVTITSVDVYAASQSGSSIQISITNTSTSTNYLGPSTSINAGSNNTKITVPVNISLSPGTYKMEAIGTGSLYVSTAPAYPLTNTSVSITGSEGLGSYVFFYNWQISEGSGCGRLPVIAQVGGCSVAAPVTFGYVEAIPGNGYTAVKWITYSEYNNNYFEVERSDNGNVFTALNRIYSLGNSTSIHQYEYDDYGSKAGIYYYRIVQYDLNGNSSFSNVVKVNVTGTIQCQSSPNPFAEETEIKITNAPNENIQIMILDLTGKVISELYDTSVSSERIITVGQNLQAGVYICRIVSDNKEWNLRLIKSGK